LSLGLRFIILLIVALGAGVHAPGKAAARDNVARLGIQLEPPGLDPTIGAAAAIREVTFHTIFEGLVRQGPKGEILPWLATDWRISPDGLSYIFNLRPGVRFHDGAPFDADAVKFSLDRARAANSKNAQRQAFSLIDDVRVIDPGQVEIILKRRFSGLLAVLSYGDAAMVAPLSAEANNTKPVGTGPFQFDSWRRGDSIHLDRAPLYWGPMPHLAGITFKVIGDSQAAYAAIESGEIDGFPAFPAPELVERLVKDPRFVVHTGPGQGKTILALNNAKAPFDNLTVRQAFSHAINRTALIEGAMFGFGAPIGSHYGPLDEGYIDLTGTYPFDLPQAKALLAKAGIQPGLSLRLALPPTTYARRSGEMIAAQLAAIGIKVRIEQLEWAVWLDQVFTRHDFDMTIVAHVEPLDYEIYGRSTYYFGYQNAHYRDLLAAVDQAVDSTTRRVGLAEIQQVLARDAVNVYLFQLPSLGVFRANLKDIWHPTPLRSLDLDRARLDDAMDRPEQAQTSGPKVTWPVGTLALGLVLAGLIFIARRQLSPRQIVDRLGILALTMLGASIAIFLLVQIAPGDPARQILGMGADIQAVDALRREMGLDQPAWHRAITWIAGMMQGDFGISYAYRVPVIDLVIERIGLSGPLALMAMVLSLGFALILALAASAWPDHLRGRIIDRLVHLISLIMVAIPNFYVGMILVLVLALQFGLVPAGGFPGWDAGMIPAMQALFLPALALAIPQAGLLARILREELRRVNASDFIRTARAKGLTRYRIMFSHALPNAGLTVLTILGLQFSYLLAGTILIENVFALPGLGRLAFQAVGQRDLPLLQSLSALLVFAVVVISFIIDLLARVIDPRLQSRQIT